jgi:hypothetical protein
VLGRGLGGGERDGLAGLRGRDRTTQSFEGGDPVDPLRIIASPGQCTQTIDQGMQLGHDLGAGDIAEPLDHTVEHVFEYSRFWRAGLTGRSRVGAGKDGRLSRSRKP